MSRSHWIPKDLFLRNDPNKGCFGKTTLPRPQVIFEISARLSSDPGVLV